MDQVKYSTLYAALQAVPDPRQARGKQHSWSVLMTLLASAMASGHKQVWAMAHWAALHAQEIIETLDLQTRRVPSVATLYRAVHAIDVTVLERCLADYTASLTRQSQSDEVILLTGERVRGQAVDGKEIRGASAHGEKVKLVSLVEHIGRVVDQRSVAPTRGEQTAVPSLLAQRDLRATVTTLDAGLASRGLARQIRDQNGHYFMVVKGNQGEVRDAVALLFTHPRQVPWLPHETEAYYRCDSFTDKGHGRVETRIVETTPYLNDYLMTCLGWPDVGQVVCRTRCCRHQRSGKTTFATTYALTSLAWHEAMPDHIERLWRGHWMIENRAHYVRDETMGEDRGQIHGPRAPHVLAAVRNALLNLFRSLGWTNMAAALRYYAASVPRALALIGAISPRL